MHLAGFTRRLALGIEIGAGGEAQDRCHRQAKVRACRSGHLPPNVLGRIPQYGAIGGAAFTPNVPSFPGGGKPPSSTDQSLSVTRMKPLAVVSGRAARSRRGRQPVIDDPRIAGGTQAACQVAVAQPP